MKIKKAIYAFLAEHVRHSFPIGNLPGRIFYWRGDAAGDPVVARVLSNDVVKLLDVPGIQIGKFRLSIKTSDEAIVSSALKRFRHSMKHKSFDAYCAWLSREKHRHKK